MNDRAVSLLDQYDVEILGTRKGRDAILCDTPAGCLIFKEYRGQKERLPLQNELLLHMQSQGFSMAERLLATKEGEFFVKDRDGTDYILKTYLDGRECNIQNIDELEEVVGLLSKMHDAMEIPIQDGQAEAVIQACSPLREYEKKNRELKRVRNFLHKKSQKSEFELRLSECYDMFLNQALEVTDDWARYDETLKKQSGQPGTAPYCHGDFQYHNILNKDGEWFIMNFEKFVIDQPVRDLYLLLRKLLEKNDWSVEIGKRLIEAYERERPLSAVGRIDLYYRLSYPDKFRKIVNYYFNSRKAWIPGKNLEKLKKLMEQEPLKQAFLQEAFHL